MGLDMYLYRKQHYNGRAEGIKEVELRGEKNRTIPLAEHSGVIIASEMGYWRKANAIHRWFVERGGGEDDCRPIPISIDDLKELLELCRRVKATARKRKGLVKNGFGGVSDNSKCVRATIQYSGGHLQGFELGEKTTIENINRGEWCMMEDMLNGNEEYRNGNNIQQAWVVGETVSNPSELAGLLPTQQGFFFGNTDYDEWYLQSVDDTIEILERTLEKHTALVAGGAKEYDIDYEYQASW